MLNHSKGSHQGSHLFQHILMLFSQHRSTGRWPLSTSTAKTRKSRMHHNPINLIHQLARQGPSGPVSPAKLQRQFPSLQLHGHRPPRGSSTQAKWLVSASIPTMCQERAGTTHATRHQLRRLLPDSLTAKTRTRQAIHAADHQRHRQAQHFRERHCTHQQQQSAQQRRRVGGMMTPLALLVLGTRVQQHLRHKISSNKSTQ